MILQVVVWFFIPSPTQCSGVVCEVSPQTVSATWETKDLHLLCSSKLRRKHPRVSVIVHTVRSEALASLLKIKDTGVHQQMDMFMWFCAATMFKSDISLMLSLQLSRLVPRFYQTNDHSLKQTDSRASAWLGPPGGGGVHPLVFIRQSAGTQFRLRSPDVTRSHAGLFCAAAAAAELRKSGCTEVLLSLKNTADILLFNFSSGPSTSSRSRKCNYFCLG